MTTVKAVFLSGGPAWLFVKAVTAVFGLIALSRLVPGRNRQVPKFRPMYGVTLGAFFAVAAVGVIAGLSAVKVDDAQDAALLRAQSAQTAARLRAQAAQTARIVAGTKLPSVARPGLGVFEDGEETSWTRIKTFGVAVGRQPDIVTCYQGWGAPFPTAFADTAGSHAAALLIQWLPKGISMAAVAAGHYDTYLRSYASEARAFPGQFILSFAPEANGNWYTYGWTHTRPATWVAAWRHVVTVFRASRVSNITWLWTVNKLSKTAGPYRDYWPGTAYVDWVGLDNYIYTANQTFNSAIGPSVAALRTISNKPVLIAETAVGQLGAPVRNAPGLVTGVISDHLLGLVWFDMRQSGSLYNQDWRIEDHPRAAAAMRRAIVRYMP